MPCWPHKLWWALRRTSTTRRRTSSSALPALASRSNVSCYGAGRLVWWGQTRQTPPSRRSALFLFLLKSVSLKSDPLQDGAADGGDCATAHIVGGQRLERLLRFRHQHPGQHVGADRSA